MTYFAYEVHDDLIEQEGITADMPDYYTSISARVEAQFPDRFFTPGSASMEQQAPVVLAGGQISTPGVTPMYRQGSSIGTGLFRQGSSIGPTIYRQGSSLGPTIYRQGSSIGSGMYRQTSAIPTQLSNATYAPRLYRGSSSVAAMLLQQQQPQQPGAVADSRVGPAVPTLPLSRRPTGDKMEGPHSDRGVGSLYDRKLGTPRVPLSDFAEEASHEAADVPLIKQPSVIPLTQRLSDQVAADMAWAVGQRADLA